MTCASCAARIEKKLNKLDRVTATVNFATEKAAVSFPGPDHPVSCDLLPPAGPTNRSPAASRDAGTRTSRPSRSTACPEAHSAARPAWTTTPPRRLTRG
jgi:P-type Cu+ transporter